MKRITTANGIGIALNEIMQKHEYYFRQTKRELHERLIFHDEPFLQIELKSDHGLNDAMIEDLKERFDFLNSN